MSGRIGATLGCLLLLVSASFAQSLAELAKKERERRKQNKGNVRVIDDEVLRQGRPQDAVTPSEGNEGEATQGPTPPASGTSDGGSAFSSARPSTTASGRTSLNELKERREKCDEQLRRAEDEKKRQQALFDQGVTSVATIDTTRPRVKGAPAGTPGGMRSVGVDRNGNPIWVPASPPAKIDVAGSRISCNEALSSSSKYPAEASQCGSIKRRIESADAAIRQAGDCLRSR